jgi:TP901 family phage tail tape measure protein
MVGMRADVTLDVNTSKAKRSMDRAAAELNKSINGISKKQVSFNVNSKSFTQPLGRITASANEFTKSLEASNARVIAFGASVGIINAISDAFKSLVVETVKFEKVLQDINVIVGASSGKLKEFGDGLFNVAKNTAQAFTISAEAALEFSRQGLTMEETLKRTNDALILTRLTGLDAASAVSGLTAAVNAFGDAGLSTTDIIDKLAAVDVKFAVSSEDLIKALERTGAVAIDAGVEIDSLIGLVTALQQTTARGGAVIGNGLKTIFTRIQRPESIRQLEEMGIAVKNLSGAILPADKIMLNMAKTFDNLSQSQQSNIVQFSAGIFQANVFRAALRDLSKEQSIQAQATEIAGNAAGDAAQKNEMLNKTMAAMASQTSTSIQELAETLGSLGLAPDIEFFLSSIKDGIDGIKNTLGGGEDEGSTFAKGLVKGIGNVITGPAAIAFGAIFIKLFVNIAKFARTSLKDVLGIVNEKDKIRAMEESILKALGENVKLQEGLSNLEDDRKAQELFILGIIEKQNSAMTEQVNLAARLAKPLVKAGINPDFTKNEASGMVPVAASGMIPESSKKKERQGAAQGGYAAGAVDSMNVKGIGTVVYNKAEKVKKFPGMNQPAIMPPEQSRAGKGYKDAFAGQHGFDPYASGGFVPNFARMEGSKLKLDPALNQLSANPESARTTEELVESYRKLAAAGRPIAVEATTKQLLANTGGSHSKKVKEVIQYLQDNAGVESIERDFVLKRLPKRGRRTEKQAEDDVRKAEGKKYFSTGGRSGDPTFPVDLVGLGMTPIEVKSGEWKLPNVLLKSLRLYSDDGLMRFAESQGATEEMINAARSEKFRKGGKLLIKKGLLEKSSTQQEVHEKLISHRMSSGLVPNFAGGLTMMAKSIAAEFSPKRVSISSAEDGEIEYIDGKDKTEMFYTALAKNVKKSAEAVEGEEYDKSISTIAAEMGIAESTISNSKNPKTSSGKAARRTLGAGYNQYVKNLDSISKKNYNFIFKEAIYSKSNYWMYLSCHVKLIEPPQWIIIRMSSRVKMSTLRKKSKCSSQLSMEMHMQAQRGMLLTTLWPRHYENNNPILPTS